MDAGVSTSLVHYHFETRDALLEQALEYSYELAGDVRLGPEGDAHDLDSAGRLAAMIDQCLPYPGMLERDWILWVELWLRAVRHEEMRPTAARLYARMREWFAEAIATGIERGRASRRRGPGPGGRPDPRAGGRLRSARPVRGPGRGRRAPRDLGRDRSRARPPRRCHEAPRRARRDGRRCWRSRRPAAAQPLTVETFNVWYGGGQVEFNRIGNAIKAAGADVVGIQEPEGNLRRIADVAGHVLHGRDAPPDLALPDLRGGARRRALRLRGGRAGPRRRDRRTSTCPPRRTGRRWSATASRRRRC